MPKLIKSSHFDCPMIGLVVAKSLYPYNIILNKILPIHILYLSMFDEILIYTSLYKKNGLKSALFEHSVLHGVLNIGIVNFIKIIFFFYINDDIFF